MSSLREHPSRFTPEYRVLKAAEIERLYADAVNYSPPLLSLKREIFQGVTPTELRNLAYRVLDTNYIDEVYTLMATPTSRGETFYDVLIGPQHQRGREVLAKVLRAYEPQKVDRGLDVGAGTGASSSLLAGYCRRITVTDANIAMLKVAQGRMKQLHEFGKIKGYNSVLSDAVEMPFKAEAFDIIIDHAILAYLNFYELRQYWVDVIQALKPGGRYYQYHVEKPDTKMYSTTPLAKLAGAVVDCAFARTYAQQMQQQQFEKFDPFEGQTIRIIGSPYFEQVVYYTKPEP